MSQSKIVFTTPNGARLVRTSLDTSAAEMISQATEEFGQVNVLEMTEGGGKPQDEREKQKKDSLKAVLEAAHHNVKVCYDQIESLDDDHPMENVKQQLKEAAEAIASELERFNA